MNGPISVGAFSPAPDVTCLASTIPVPGLGVLPVNAFVVDAPQPVLIDTGLPALVDQTIASLQMQVDPGDLRWIWLTHCDADHVGALEALLGIAPHARVVTNYLGMGKLSMRLALPPERFYLINPGQSLDVGDRKLRAVALPCFDAPETMGVFDPSSRSLFSSDCFGALLDEVYATASLEDVAAVEEATVAEGLATWTLVDAPWLTSVDEAPFRRSLSAIGSLGPAHVLGAHLPPAHGKLAWLSEQLDRTRSRDPFVGPDQAALEAMLGAAAE